MMNILNGGAHADNNVDIPGVHDRAGGRSHVRAKRCAGASRSTTRSRSVLHDAGLGGGVGDEGGFAPTLAIHERRAARPASVTRDARRPAIAPGADVVPRAWTPPPRSSTTPTSRPLPCWRASGRELTSDELVDYWRGACVDTTRIISLEDGMGGGRTGTGWKALTGSASVTACSWWATTCSSRTPSAWPRASSMGCAQRHPHQGEPDRHASTETLRGHRDGASRAGYACVMIPPLRRDRGHHHRRPGRRPATLARSRPALPAAATAWPSTTSLLRIEEELDIQATYAGMSAFYNIKR